MDNAPSVTVRRVSYFLRAASAIGLKGNPPWGIERNDAIPQDRRIEFRIGINVGDTLLAWLTAEPGGGTALAVYVRDRRPRH